MFIWHLYVYCPSPFIVNELLPWPLLACTYSCTCRIIVFSFFLAVADSEILRGGCNIQCIGPSVPSSFIANADSELNVRCVCYLPWCTVVLAEAWIVGTNKLNLESFCMEKATCWKFGKANRGKGAAAPSAPWIHHCALQYVILCAYIYLCYSIVWIICKLYFMMTCRWCSFLFLLSIGFAALLLFYIVNAVKLNTCMLLVLLCQLHFHIVLSGVLGLNCVFL